jgi:glycosyltransferase involved in cell wall biosynthesis
VSIVIPTDNRDNLFNCIDLLKRHTDYRPYEIVAVTNSALGHELLQRHAGDPGVRLCAYDLPFNFSAKCNAGAAAARGEYLLFLNDDVEATHGSWLEDMLGVFGRGGVGGVSPKLFYENDTIQHAGMVTGVRGLVGTAFHAQPKDSGVHFNLAQSERDVSLLSGACLLMPRRVFDEVGGWDARHTPIMHSDVDLCLRIRERGHALVYTPFAALRHIGHLSLKATDHLRERRKDKADTYLLKRFGPWLSRDPWYPENMRAYLYHAGHVPYHMDLPRQDEALLAAADILLVSHDLSLSGAPILLLQLATHFRARGHFVTVMSPLDGELAAAYRARGIPVIVDATLAGRPDAQTAKLMAAFDLILANTIVTWPSVEVGVASGTPVLWLLHESMAGREMALAQPAIVRALAAADDVVFACAATRRLYEDLVDGGRFHVIPYGTRAPEPPADVVRDPTRFTLVHIGSIEPRKGQDLLLDALARLPAALRSRLNVQLIGRVLDPEFHARIRPALEGTPGVRHLGPLPHDATVRHLAAADLLVCASRDEVFPVTILEAMALGRPVLSTAVGGVPEMIRDGIDGLVVPPLDAQALADAIATLMQDPARGEGMGRAARQRFQDAFTIDRLGDRLLALIEPRLPAAAPGR